MSYNYKHIICSNCGLAGHIFKKCRKPKISLGIIAFKQAIETNEIVCESNWDKQPEWRKLFNYEEYRNILFISCIE